MSYGFSRADALYYDHVFSEPPDDWLGNPDEDENEEETEMEDTKEETEMEDTKNEKIYC